MNSESDSQLVRSKILGTIIREGRLSSRKSISDCAIFLELTEDEFEEFELGKRSPSLPQLEFIAYFLDVPVDGFWSGKTYTESQADKYFYNIHRLIQIRGRIIGALIKQARLNKNLSVEELSQMTRISSIDLEAIELGKIPIELPQLESVAINLDLSIQDFQDKDGIAGKWSVRQQIQRDFLELPEDLQIFVSGHENRPYLELAKRLSEISAEKLRSIAEGILEITY